MNINFLVKSIATICFPVLLVLSTARLYNTKAVYSWEYKKKSFPKDPYGFTTEERIEYGGKFLDYLFVEKDIKLLKQMEFSSGGQMFNNRELRHMVDVQKIVIFFEKFGIGVVICFFLSIFMLVYLGGMKEVYSVGLLGSGLTLAMILTALVMSIFSFNFVFENFHKILGFETGTWVFYVNDSLIRLFPIKFWLDMFISIFVIVIAVSLGVFYISYKKLRK